MLQIKIGIQLASLRLPFKKALHTAAALGAQAVEIDARSQVRPREISQTGVRQLRKMLEDQNLCACALSFHTHRGYNVADGLDRRVDATKEAMQLAYRLGAPIVINHVGRVPAEPSGAEWELLVEVLTDLGLYGQRVGAVLAAETGSEEGEQLARLIRALPEGSLAVNFDPGDLVIQGYSPQRALEALGPYVMHVHAKDGTRDASQQRGLETPLGRGSVDFPDLLGRLEEYGYRGYFTIERERAEDPVEEIGQAVRFLRNLA